MLLFDASHRYNQNVKNAAQNQECNSLISVCNNFNKAQND